MKKKTLVAMMMAAVMMIGMTACGKTTVEEIPTVFPAGTLICGVDVGGMDPTQAQETVAEKIDEYTIKVALDEIPFEMHSPEFGLGVDGTVSFEELMLSANEIPEGEAMMEVQSADILALGTEHDIQKAMLNAYSTVKSQMEAEAKAAAAEAAAAAAENGEEIPEENTNPAEEEEVVSRLLDVTLASIAYDEEKGMFVGVDGIPGDHTDYSGATKELMEAVRQMEDEISVKSVITKSNGEKASESLDIPDALKFANAFLNTNLRLSFTPANGETSYEEITNEMIASWLNVQNDGLTIEVNTGALSIACNEMAEKYSVQENAYAKFETTYGDLIDIRVSRAGETIEPNDLYTTLYNCLVNKLGGTVAVEYCKVSEAQDIVDFDGSYVEIDLTNQRVYCYYKGEQVVAADCVSGCVADGYATPTGVFSIFQIGVDTYLVGPDYRSYVNYFLAFNGDIGLHDASWRGAFGGSIYKYNGSHGCVNLPYWAANAIYKYTDYGTKVIVYGGVGSVPQLERSWSGPKEYTVTLGDSGFKLGRIPEETKGITYTSSNPGVVTVSDSGDVTIVGVGTATIRVWVPATTRFTEDYSDVTITVRDKAQAQTITTSSDSFSLSTGSSAYIGASAPSGKLSFRSSNTSVVTVDGNGMITGVGAGTAQITINAEANDTYNAATKTVTVTVTAAPAHTHSFGGWQYDGSSHYKECACGATAENGSHSMTDWVTVVEATTTSTGTKERHCGVCGYTETDTIPMIEEQGGSESGEGEVNP